MLSNKYSDLKLEAGADEAGRGCLSGPVTAAAVLFSYEQNSDFFKLYEKNLKRIDDSKKLSEKMRFELRPFIEQSATSFSVTHVEPVVIDKINILNASIKAMQESILKLSHQPEYVIIDGNAPFISRHGIQNTAGKIFSQEEIVFLKSLPTMSIVGGDTKYLSIAAASILAKTYRDEYMDNIHEEFSVYNWRKNKGYPTKEHREAIAKYGICKYHRLSFRLL